MTLQSKVLRGSVWVVAFRWFARFLGLINVAIVARILGPEDFGLVAMAMLVLGLIEAWLAFGLENACVQRADLQREHLDTAWSMRLIQGAVVTALIAAAAPFAATYFKDPRVAPLIWVLASGIFVASLGNIGIVMFRREMDFQAEFKLQVSAKLIGFVLGLGAVLWLRNYWGLVVGMLAGIVATTALSYVMQPFRPRWDLSRWRELWHFSKWMFVVNLAQFGETRVDEAVVGRLGASDMGLYVVPSDLGQMPVNEIAAPVNRVLFPAFASVQDDPPRLRDAYVRTLEAVAAVTFPAGVGLALVAEPAIAVMLGAKWLPGAAVLSLIAIFAIGRSLAASTTSFFLAIGRPKIVAALSLLSLLLFLATMTLIGLERGPAGVAQAKLVSGLLATLVAMFAVTRFSLVTPLDLVRVLVRPALACLAMAGALTLAAPYWPAVPILQLVCMIVAGGAVYVSATLLLWSVAGRPEGPESLALAMLARLRGKRAA